MWGKEIHDDEWIYPCLNEILDGLINFYGLIMNKIETNNNVELIQKIKSCYSTVFNLIRDLIQLDDNDKPFIATDDLKAANQDYNLRNPKSKAVFLVLWLYSIEPPFYFYLNQACRRMDATLLNMLGPFA